MASKRPPPTFEVVFSGPGIVPWTISLAQLSRAFSAVQKLASGDVSEGVEEEEDSLSLLGVKKGSARFQCAAKVPARAIANVRLTGKVLSDPDRADQIAYAFNPIEDLSSLARSLNCIITIRRPDDESGVLARIEPGTFSEIARTLLLSGQTTVMGRVERVGGSTDMRCSLRVPAQSRLLYCRVKTPDAVRKLGQSLYEDVSVTGLAQWIRNSWRIVSFEIFDVQQPKTGSLLKAFAELRAAGGKGWDGVKDPKKFLREVSGQ